MANKPPVFFPVEKLGINPWPSAQHQHFNDYVNSQPISRSNVTPVLSYEWGLKHIYVHLRKNITFLRRDIGAGISEDWRPLSNLINDRHDEEPSTNETEPYFYQEYNLRHPTLVLPKSTHWKLISIRRTIHSNLKTSTVFKSVDGC